MRLSGGLEVIMPGDPSAISKACAHWGRALTVEEIACLHLLLDEGF
jgi:hypothetical protein